MRPSFSWSVHGEVFMPNLKRSVVGVSLALLLGASGSASAIDLLAGFGGNRDFGQLAMLPNDDGSSNQLSLPFDINFFGNTFSNFFVNNNGNITFGAELSDYTPNPFPISSRPM